MRAELLSGGTSVDVARQVAELQRVLMYFARLVAELPRVLMNFARLRLAARSLRSLAGILPSVLLPRRWRGGRVLSCGASVDFARLRLAARGAEGAACGMLQAIGLPRRPRSAPGFTLLEVMAAVALLGTVYTVLGGAGIQGLQHEGESRRRIQGSLIADAMLAELEASADAGQVAQPGKQERRQGDFTVEIEIAPLDLSVPDDPNPLPEPPIGGKPANLPDALSASLLRSDGRTPSPLRRITVRVGWTEGWGDRSVVRTTYALDTQSVKSELDALDQAAAPPTQAAPQAPQAQTPQAGNQPAQQGQPIQ
jgi:prepilin-type N-terminal cleavage/methylation domain-containing protein